MFRFGKFGGGGGFYLLAICLHKNGSTSQKSFYLQMWTQISVLIFFGIFSHSNLLPLLYFRVWTKKLFKSSYPSAQRKNKTDFISIIREAKQKNVIDVHKIIKTGCQLISFQIQSAKIFEEIFGCTFKKYIS
jgi:hypothetical protein